MKTLQEGPEPLPRCEQCGMHIPEAWLIKPRLKERVNKETKMRLRHRDVWMAERCGEIKFSMYGEEGNAMVEGVENFKYLGRPRDQTDGDWPAIRQNIMHTRTIWGRLGNLSIHKGADQRVTEMFYRVVAQTVLIFGLETWVILAEIERKVEVTHMGFMRQLKGKGGATEFIWDMIDTHGGSSAGRGKN